MSTSLFSNTPSVMVSDNRGLTVRDIVYHCHPDSPDVTTERITRHQYDARGFLTQSVDPRLHETARANFSYLTNLAGSVLRTVSTDAGTTVALNDAAGRPVIVVSNINTTDDGTEDRSQAVTRTWQYENADQPGRPVSVTEQMTGGVVRISERLVYAGNTDAEKALNLAGQCINHCDTSGLVQVGGVALTGVPLSVTRRLLKNADNPDVLADWQGDDVSAWNDLLATDMFTTLTTADATGVMRTTTDVKGNLQRVEYDVAGLLSSCWMTLKGGEEQAIVQSLTYSAAGQKQREEHGNGVVTTYKYEPQTQRLTGIRTERPAWHDSGAKVLQDLRYEYDPVGNVLKISNDAEPTTFWRNQKVVPENTYTYDSLYQLVTATGREMANAGQARPGQSPAAAILPVDGSTFTNYTRTYTYDRGGNLTQISHRSPATGNNHTTTMTVSDRSNRTVLSDLTPDHAQVEGLFTARGQQKELLKGQTLTWNTHGELAQVGMAAGNRESYRYDGSSQRILKVSVQNTGSSTQMQRVLYLPGLEIRNTKAGGEDTESLLVITMEEAGRASVRVLHWEAGKPDDISNDQVRYSYDNLTGNSGLELDGGGNIISLEEYYPYGGTAVLTVRSRVEVRYKTMRFSGKERDATGLYYYGYRYYQPWAGRWLSADPAETVDGLNLYRMVRNNPGTLKDGNGLETIQLPQSRIKLFAMRHLPLSLFNTSLMERISGVRLRPSAWGRYGTQRSSDFVTKKITQDEFYKHVGLYSDIHKKIYWRQRPSEISRGREAYKSAKEAQANHEILGRVLGYVVDALKPENKLLNTQYDFYKMVKKRSFLEKLRGAPRDEVPYALSLTSFDSVDREFGMDEVITHPYTQYSRVHQEIREFVLPDEIGADFNWLRGGTGKYLIFSLGEAMSTRTTIHALRNLPSDIHSVYTVAINKRSQNIAKKYTNL